MTSVLAAAAGSPHVGSGWRLVKQMPSASFPAGYYDRNGEEVFESRSPKLSGMFFVNAQYGWVVGEAGLVAQTADGGETWTERLLNPSDHFEGVFFLNSRRGWVVGNREIKGPAHRGLVLGTDDGGATWRELYVDNQFELSWLSGVWFVSDLVGWVVGEAQGDEGTNAGVILSTRDGGKKWRAQHFDRSSGSSLDSVKFQSERDGWATGTTGILLTNDRGIHWYSQRSGSGSVFDLIGSSEAWVAGGKNTLLHTGDRGKNWRPVSIPFEQRSLRLVHIKFEDRRNGWVVAVDGTIFHTTDGGKTWTWDLPDLEEDIQGGFATSLSFFGFTNGGAIFRKDR